MAASLARPEGATVTALFAISVAARTTGSGQGSLRGQHLSVLNSYCVQLMSCGQPALLWATQARGAAASGGIKVRIARSGIEDKTKLGRHGWVVERTVSWLLRFKRLGLRYDRTEATLRPLLLLAVSIINLRRLVSITDF